MFFYLYNGFGVYIKFETKRGSLVLLTGSYDHAFSFFRDVNTLGCFYTSQTHHLDFSVMLPLFPLQIFHLCREMNHQQTESF